MFKLLKREKGFTLVELMVVILIIAILIAVAIPVYNASRASARNKTCKANLRTLDGAIQTYNSDNDTYPSAIGDLDPTYVKFIPTCPNGGTYSLVSQEASCSTNGTLTSFTDS